jgi:ectoine hydroxylase-related dioxygenase (phytanoyl-CoA dioxygenase family)
MPMDKDFLDREQIDAFRRDGYLVVRAWYDRDRMAELSAAIDELAARVPERGKQMVYNEDSLRTSGERVLSRIEKFCEHHDTLARLAHEPRLTGALGQLLGDEAVLFKDKINFKLPGGAGFTPHQDIQPGWDDYAPYFISVLVTVDRSTAANGCLELAAGHHTRGMIGERWKPLEGPGLAGMVFEKYPMEPGDVAFFDCFAPHRSGPNLTDEPRRNLYLTYNRASDGDHRERYFADKRRNYPPDNEREPGKEYVFRV